MCIKVSQDVPKYMMVSGERAELRGLNLEGLRRHRFTAAEVCINKICHDDTFLSYFILFKALKILYDSV